VPPHHREEGIMLYVVAFIVGFSVGWWYDNREVLNESR
jgi:hypothetical protein